MSYCCDGFKAMLERGDAYRPIGYGGYIIVLGSSVSTAYNCPFCGKDIVWDESWVEYE